MFLLYFFQRLSQEIESRGHSCICENWPDPFVCHESKWLNHIINTLKCDENTVVIGHSTGALLAMRLLEKIKIKGAILISAAHTHLDDEGEKASGYFDKPWNWDAMRDPSHSDFIIQFHSKDDHLIPVSEARFVAEKLGKSSHHIYVELENYGHFFKPFQPILECIPDHPGAEPFIIKKAKLNWAYIAEDLILCIASFLRLPELATVLGVCKPWRQMFLKHLHRIKEIDMHRDLSRNRVTLQNINNGYSIKIFHSNAKSFIVPKTKSCFVSPYRNNTSSSSSLPLDGSSKTIFKCVHRMTPMCTSSISAATWIAKYCINVERLILDRALRKECEHPISNIVLNKLITKQSSFGKKIKEIVLRKLGANKISINTCIQLLERVEIHHRQDVVICITEKGFRNSSEQLQKMPKDILISLADLKEANNAQQMLKNRNLSHFTTNVTVRDQLFRYKKEKKKV